LKSVTGGLKEQRENRNIHQKAVTKIERKLLIGLTRRKLNFGGYKS
jgi:hypothetical protein